MPPQYLDIVGHCLRRDPSLRWTIDEIAARIRSGSPIVAEPLTSAGNAFVNWRYVVPIAALVLGGLVFAGRKLTSRHPEPPRTSSTAPANPQLNVQSDSRTNVPKMTKTNPAHGKAGQASNSSTPTVPFQSSEHSRMSTAALVKGAVVEQVLPNVPQSASDTITGTVRVRVKVAVDPTGNVTDAALESPGPSKYFANLALRAARRWKFKPAQKDGQDVASEWILTFGFRKTSSTASPLEVAP
jgi:TonB family protein